MAKTDYKFLVGSVISGVLSFVFLIASLSTENWVTADVNNNINEAGNVKLGLFTGRYDRVIIGKKNTFYLAVTCMISEGICMWSCRADADSRYDELEKLFNTGEANFQCDAVSEKSISRPRQTGIEIDKDAFLQAGLWISSIFFLILALVVNIVAVGFNIYNIFYNPIYSFASIFGLYIYYSIAACSTTLAIILWGAEFGKYTTKNIAILDTLADRLDVDSYLGFSYFFMIISLLAQFVSIALIYYRQYRINKAKEETVVRVDDKTNDASTFMY